MTDLAMELDLPSAEPADPNSIRIENPVDGSLVGRTAMATPRWPVPSPSGVSGWAATSADQRAAALRAAPTLLADRAADWRR